MTDIVNTDHLRQDAEVWKGWSSDLMIFVDELQSALTATSKADWGISSIGTDLYDSWKSLVSDTSDYFKDGADAMESTACTLLKAALEAEVAEGASREELAQTLAELRDL